MHLRSTRKQTVAIPGSRCKAFFLEGETIWTESSHKYRPNDISGMATRNGFRRSAQWLDSEWPFAESLLIAQ
jgi:L-histidine Nalpha-methyltransferase